MDERRSVLVLDDGELDDVLKILRYLQVPFLHLRGEAIPEQLDAPEDLLISTAARAEAVPFTGPAPAGEQRRGPVRIGMVDREAGDAHTLLRRTGFDYLVRRPVHPEAIRLLIQHALYRGEEKRREQRRAVGSEVAYKTALFSHKAILIDLSDRGCRIHASRPIREDARIRLVLPEAVTEGKPLKLSGRVLRCAKEDRAGPAINAFATAVVFDPPKRASRERLAKALERRALGPSAYAPPEANTPWWWEIAKQWRSAARHLAGAVRRAPPAAAAPVAATEHAETAEAECAGPGGLPLLRAEDFLAAEETAAPAPGEDSPAAEEEEPAEKPQPVIVVPGKRRRKKGRKRAKSRQSTGEATPTALVAPPRAAVDAEARAAAQASAFPWADAATDDLPALKAGPKVGEVGGGLRAGERRRHPRGHFEREVISIHQLGDQAMVGRDLSLGGMRVERCEGLAVGDRFRIAIYASAREEPLVVGAAVVQDYGDSSFGISFDKLELAAAARLEKLVASLPAVETPLRPKGRSVASVICEVQPDDD